MKIEEIHHVAYRCRDAKETVEWYGTMLKMDFVLAFFELPNQPEMGRDPNTAVWVQHIAFRDHLAARGVDVLGVTDHGMFHSIYCFDPNGHRVELACPDPEEEAMIARADAVKWQMLEAWSQTKRAPKHAAFLHAHTGGGHGGHA
jgi:catechol 2,3-dioxygenase-like lactoylglutathione lyase family enzyme